MFNINPIIDDFLGGIPVMEDKKSGKTEFAYPLNSLLPLDFLLSQEEHDAQFQRILDSTHSKVSPTELKQLVKDEVTRLELLKETYPNIESLKPLGGKNLNPLIYSHRIWGFHSLYTSYDFTHKSYEEIQVNYDYRIGAIALNGIEEITFMKQKEQTTGDDVHGYKFYEATETARTRAIEFLATGSMLNSQYFNKRYLDDTIEDPLHNFFRIQTTDALEAECLYVAKTREAGMVMQYKNEAEGVSFQAITFRTLRTLNSLGSFDAGSKKILQLQNLDGPSRNSRYKSKVVLPKSTNAKMTIEPLVEELEAQLYGQVRELPRVNNEEKLELNARTKFMRRDDGEALDREIGTTEAEATIPTSYMQSRRNRTVSAQITKNGLNLPSDYSTPPTDILCDFFASLSTNTDDEKLVASIIAITTITGSQISYTVDMLMGKKDSIVKYKDGKLSVKIDTTIFASSMSSEYLGTSEKMISFKTPHLMSMLISYAKNNISNRDEEINKDELIEQCKEYLKESVKQFPKKIAFSVDTLHRPLRAYARAIGADTLTANFATATYNTNERAKMAYNATNKDSQTHSNLVNNYWVELKLDEVARSVLGIGSPVFAAKAIEITESKYAGSSKCVNIKKTQEFFAVLDENIRIATILEDNDRLFKLVTVKMGYEMSLLAGTRSFNNSTDFSSWSYDLGIVIISEKAESVAAGLRVIPICDELNDGLKSYTDTFLKPRGLKQKLCFYSAQNAMPFNQHSAKKVLHEIPNLVKRAILEEYVKNVPTNTGRHCISKKATELSIPTEFISTFLGHNFAGSEQFGIYSTLDTKRYYEDMRYATSSIASEFGIGDPSW